MDLSLKLNDFDQDYTIINNRYNFFLEKTKHTHKLNQSYILPNEERHTNQRGGNKYKHLSFCLFFVKWF